MPQSTPEGIRHEIGPEIQTEEILRKFSKKLNFLSKITGLPVTSACFGIPFVPENPKGHLLRYNIGYRTTVVLSDGNNTYRIEAQVKFSDVYTHGEPLPASTWSLQFNGEPLNQRQEWTYATFDCDRFFDPKKRRDYLWEEFEHAIGGPDTEIAFMDYESYSTTSLNTENEYFSNIYLMLMAHMKERGLPMPPILMKQEQIKALIHGKENMQELENRLRTFICLASISLDERCRNHMEYEAQEILGKIKWEKKKKDPSLSLEKTFPNLPITILKGERLSLGLHGILVVENDLDQYGKFTNLITKALERDGRWRDSVVASTVNLSESLEICGTGKIDVVLFDWRNPSIEEIYMVWPTTINPFIILYNDNTQTVINLANRTTVLPDGRTLNKDQMEEEAERLNIRNLWAEKIKKHCRQMEVVDPVFYIVRNSREAKDVAMIVAQLLNKPLT